MHGSQSQMGRSPPAWLGCNAVCVWLVLAPAAGGEQVRRVPEPRIDPGMFLERDREADGGPQLEPIGGGRLRHKDPRFTAIIAPDGSVEFRDVVIEPDATVMGIDLLTGKLRPPKPVARDNFEERALYPQGPPTAPTMVGLGGGFGGLLGALVSKIRRKAGGLGKDSGRANMPAKVRFLAQTEGLRTRMAHAWLKARLAEQRGRLVEEVLALWRDPSLPLAERKRRIFQMWDDCAEPAELRTPTDEIQAAAAVEARVRIEGLIRMLAPRGSPQQFTAAELAEFNAQRRSRARFDPYAGR